MSTNEKLNDNETRYIFVRNGYESRIVDSINKSNKNKTIHLRKYDKLGRFTCLRRSYNSFFEVDSFGYKDTILTYRLNLVYILKSNKRKISYGKITRLSETKGDTLIYKVVDTLTTREKGFDYSPVFYKLVYKQGMLIDVDAQFKIKTDSLNNIIYDFYKKDEYNVIEYSNSYVFKNGLLFQEIRNPNGHGHNGFSSKFYYDEKNRLLTRIYGSSYELRTYFDYNYNLVWSQSHNGSCTNYFYEYEKN